MDRFCLSFLHRQRMQEILPFYNSSILPSSPLSPLFFFLWFWFNWEAGASMLIIAANVFLWLFYAAKPSSQASTYFIWLVDPSSRTIAFIHSRGRRSSRSISLFPCNRSRLLGQASVKSDLYYISLFTVLLVSSVVEN